jgi:hypothetical protein
MHIFINFPKTHYSYDEGDVRISTLVVPSDMNKPYLIVLDRTALTKLSLASLISAFGGKQLLTADLSSSMEHRIFVPPRKRKNTDYCVSITTERFPISWHELSQAKRAEVPSVVLEPVEKARLVALPGRDVPIESVQPHADEPPPAAAPSGHSAFVESPTGNERVSLGRAGAAARVSQPPRITSDGQFLTYPGQFRPTQEVKERVMFAGAPDEPSQPLNLGNMSDCWRNLDRSSRK